MDLDIVRFILELTENLWLYRYHIIRRCLFVIDRALDIVSTLWFAIFITNHTPRWPSFIHLGIYIVSRLISFALYSNTLLCKCYAVRTVISTVISSLFCNPVFILILIIPDKVTIYMILHLVAIMIGFCAAYICPIVRAFGKLKFVDDDPLQFLLVMKNNRWLIRYHKSRTYLMFPDRSADICAVCLNILYYLVSAPHRNVCLVSYIILRLISLALSYNTKLCECYAVRTVIPYISGLFCGVSLIIPLMPGVEYFGYIFIISYTMGSFCLFIAIIKKY